MKTVTLPCGERVPALGLGTWHMGDDAGRRNSELAALRRGIELGAKLIDTAEMYGEGKAERLVAEAIAGVRDDVFLVSKVYPHNATRKGAIAACERSLGRLETDRIDLYLLHWRGSVPFEETLEAFVRLKDAGKIRHFGVSNLDREDMSQFLATSGGAGVQTDQVLYNLTRRGVEWDLLPWLRERRIPVMAYSPIEQARLVSDARLSAFASEHGLSAAQTAIAWLLAKDDVIAIPKSASIERVTENVAAADVTLTPEQLRTLDALFPPPKKPAPLEML